MTDKPATRPTVPHAVEVLTAYYRLPLRGNGGAVHVITEDGNVDQGTADACVEGARAWGRTWGGDMLIETDVEVAEMLAAMTATQRRKLAQLAFYPTGEPSDD